jgi:hypothetical protein
MRDTSRVTVSPMTTRPSAPGWKPRLENGMRTSANQPSALIVVRDVQNVSQLSFVVLPSSETSRSKRMPLGVVPNHLAFWLSLKASM